MFLHIEKIATPRAHALPLTTLHWHTWLIFAPALIKMRTPSISYRSTHLSKRFWIAVGSAIVPAANLRAGKRVARADLGGSAIEARAAGEVFRAGAACVVIMRRTGDDARPRARWSPSRPVARA